MQIAHSMETSSMMLQGGRVCSSQVHAQTMQRRCAGLRGSFGHGRCYGLFVRRGLGLGMGACRLEKRLLAVRCGEDDDVDGPVQDPPYTSYNDPRTGEAMPTYGARTPLPGPAFWGEDMQRVARSGQASTPRSETKRTRKGSGREHVSKRKGSNVVKKSVEKASVPNEFEEEEKEEDDDEVGVGRDNLWYTKNDPEHDPIREAYSQLAEEEESSAGEEEEEDVGEATPVSALVAKKEEGIVESETEQLSNQELWWNWQKPPKDKEPWSAWHKRGGDSDTVMAAAMAKAGQIEIFGEKPSIAEASLARARKRVFYEERLRNEEERRKNIGSVAYYKEWVKAWSQDTSKESVEERAKKTGEGVVDQLLDMLQHQSLREYRQMQGTDIRIQRDPLTMRMPKEEVKQVWGGDPVYPTINYIQDPDCVADYRNANLHEPTPDILEQLRDSGRLITQEELRALLAKEEKEAQELEGGAFDDGMSGAIDIGDKEDDDDEDDEEDDEDIQDEVGWKVNITNHQQVPSGKANAIREARKLSPVVDLLDQVDGSDLLEYIGAEGDEDQGDFAELGN